MTALLHERVARTVERQAGRVAVVHGEGSTSYGELAATAARIAQALREVGCSHGDRVCLLLPKGLEAIASMLGALEVGCPYVPVDIASPAPRASRIVAASDARVVLVAPQAASLLDGIVAEGGLSPETVIGSPVAAHVEGERFEATFTGHDVAALTPTLGAAAVRPDDAAHILFTSGSTGEPKGVVITHANVIAFLDWAVPAFGIGDHDRLSCHPPLHFDLSTFDVFGALTTGAELHLADPRLNVSARSLARFIEAAELTQWFSVPSTMAFLTAFDAVPDGGWPSLRRVLFCGEVLPTPVLADWMRRLPHVTFTNLYGPTEATIASSYYTVPAVPGDESVPIPIGTACSGEELLVLDDRLQPTEPGETGDLYIGGAGLSPGYWRDHDKTALAFVSDPRDPVRRLYRTGDLGRTDDAGLVHFIGRSDSQIKTRGYRVELGEVEAAVNAIDLIGESAVVGIPSDGFEGTQIACAYTLADGVDAGPTDLRTRLAAVLPAYMLPSRWLELDGLPRNANGKIDRPALRELLSHDTRATVGIPVQ